MNTRNKSSNPPALQCYMNMGTLAELPEFSKAPRGDAREVLAALKDAGFQGVQGGDPKLCGELGLGISGGGRVDKVGDAAKLVDQHLGLGFDCVTVHVGTGLEDDSQAGSLIEDILRASEKGKFPIYIETHRATITQDIWRSVQWVKRFPEIRFNGDFSHWYTGLEMVYGDIEGKFNFLEPVFDRVRFIHGRIGNPGNIQVDIGDGTNQTYVDHFKEMWTRSFAGFLKSAKPGDYVVFAPELLFPRIYYARTFPDSKGVPREEGDRWQQALLYNQIARACFEEARQRTYQAGS